MEPHPRHSWSARLSTSALSQEWIESFWAEVVPGLERVCSELDLSALWLILPPGPRRSSNRKDQADATSATGGEELIRLFSITSKPDIALSSIQLKQLFSLISPTESPLSELPEWVEWEIENKGEWLFAIPLNEQPETGVLVAISPKRLDAIPRLLLEEEARRIGARHAAILQERELTHRLSRTERKHLQLESAVESGAQAERELRQRNLELNAFAEIGRILITTGTSLKESLGEALKPIIRVMEVDAAVVRLVEGDDLVIRAQRGLSEGYESTLGRLSIATSATGKVVLTGEPVILADCRNDPRITRSEVEREGIISSLVVPMTIRNKTVGAMVAFSRRLRRFAEADVLLLTTVATEIAIAVENDRLHQEELARLEALQELDRLKTDFVMTISHEVRTPLSIVKASLDALWSKWDSVSDERRLSYIRVGREGTERLKGLLEDLLLVSRIEESALVLSPRSVSLRELFDSTCKDFTKSQPSRICEVRLADEDLAVIADPDALREVLSNLLDNAAKYSSPNSEIILSAYPEIEQGICRLDVTDNGIGIAAEDMERLFKRFERIDRTVRSRSGMGIGLYIARQLIEAMKGRIWAVSNPGRGSTFSIVLPIATSLESNVVSSASRGL